MPAVKMKKGYWNVQTEQFSKTLWCPIKDNLVIIPCVKHDSFDRSKVFETNRETVPIIDTPKEDDTYEDTDIRYCRKIRIYPDKTHIELFHKCIGANRYFYNQANAYIKENYKKAVAEAKRVDTELAKTHEGCIYTRKDTTCGKVRVDGHHFCESHKHHKLNIDYAYMKRFTVHKHVVTKDTMLSEEYLWQKEIPYNTRLFGGRVVGCLREQFCVV